MKILLIAEHDHHTLKSATSHAMSAATLLGQHIDILVAGSDCLSAAQKATQFVSAQQVIHVDSKVYEHALAETMAPLIAHLATAYDYVITAATTAGKNILPRVAALLDVSMIGDVTNIISADTFMRPIYAGNAIATVQSQETKKLLTIRTTAFPAQSLQTENFAKIRTLDYVVENTVSRFESAEMTQSSRPELTSARVVISGGRGLKSADNFKLIEDIADTLGAAIGASRAAVDAGFAPNDYQVGQTGKVVAPDLYIAVGISGAIQHLAGMKDSKVIVAINNDAEAPIFQIADYGLVGDLFVILPELGEELAKVVDVRR